MKIASKPERELAAPSQKEENEIRDLTEADRARVITALMSELDLFVQVVTTVGVADL